LQNIVGEKSKNSSVTSLGVSRSTFTSSDAQPLHLHWPTL